VGLFALGFLFLWADENKARRLIAQCVSALAGLLLTAGRSAAAVQPYAVGIGTRIAAAIAAA
jgi:hypothetical protein